MAAPTDFHLPTAMKKLLLLIAACSLLSACNTMQGVGKDIKKAGEAIEGAASK
jgi:predicted small secreted protein